MNHYKLLILTSITLLTLICVIDKQNFENDNNVIDTVTNMIENKFDSIAVLDSTIGVQTIERESLIDITTGAANFDASTMIVEATISYLLNTPLFNVNDSALEVLE